MRGGALVLVHHKFPDGVGRPTQWALLLLLLLWCGVAFLCVVWGFFVCVRICVSRVRICVFVCEF